jgi:hypothetical protein
MEIFWIAATAGAIDCSLMVRWRCGSVGRTIEGSIGPSLEAAGASSGAGASPHRNRTKLLTKAAPSELRNVADRLISPA